MTHMHCILVSQQRQRTRGGVQVRLLQTMQNLAQVELVMIPELGDENYETCVETTHTQSEGFAV